MIPRVIHKIWLGGLEPEWTRPFNSTWDRPGWEIVQWDEEAVEELFPLVNQELYDAAEEIAPDHVGQIRSDILRYEILYTEGGVYVDHDFECLKPIDPLLGGVECFAAWETQDKWIANGLMGCSPGHPFLGELIASLPDQVGRTRGRGYRPNRITGPHYLTTMWKLYGHDVTILPQELIYPYGWREIAKYGPGSDWAVSAYTAHHWHNMRREKGIPCPV